MLGQCCKHYIAFDSDPCRCGKHTRANNIWYLHHLSGNFDTQVSCTSSLVLPSDWIAYSDASEFKWGAANKNRQKATQHKKRDKKQHSIKKGLSWITILPHSWCTYGRVATQTLEFLHELDKVVCNWGCSHLGLAAAGTERFTASHFNSSALNGSGVKLLHVWWGVFLSDPIAFRCVVGELPTAGPAATSALCMCELQCDLTSGFLEAGWPVLRLLELD